MLIRVIPAMSDSQVLFSITFPNYPETIPDPPYWTSQIHMLTMDELELPTSVHCLDKAAAIPALLEEVTFDISSLTITCRFVDDAVEEWPMLGAACIDALERVLFDVNEAALECEREEEREEREREREKEQEKVSEANTTPPRPLKGRHKKQRSLLMSFVASVALLPASLGISTSSRSSSSAPPPPPPPPTAQSLPAVPYVPASARRRRARSTLVDTFRLHVLTELTRRAPQGGYYTWIVQSMLRRTTDQMNALVQEAGGRVPDVVPARPGYFPEAPYPLGPSPFFSDDDSEETHGSGSTDTDGSSLHTPSSSTFRPALAQLRGEAASASYDADSTPLSSEALAAYTAYSAATLRLRQLLALANARSTHAAGEARHCEAMLEIRARRRAWLNRALVGGARSGSRDVGLATPFRRSPLGMCAWTGVDMEVVREEEDEGEALRNAEMQLFPVSEEEEDEEDEELGVARELGLEFGLDLEDGLAWQRRDVIELERPRAIPRMRTSSMHQYRLDEAVPPRRIPSSSVNGTLSSSSILCQPLSAKTLEPPPQYTEFDSGGVEFAFGAYEDSEFTLAMDLPMSVKVRDQTKRWQCGQRRVDTPRSPEHRWLAQPSLNVVSECR